MSKRNKELLIIAAFFVMVGCAIFLISAASIGWDFSKLGTGNYETHKYDITQDFTDISITTDTADIVFMPSNDGKSKVVCYEEDKENHAVSVLNGVLTIKLNDTRKWYDHINFSFKSSKITIYLPESEYSSLVINESTGDVVIAKEFTFKNIDLSLTTGDVKCYASAIEDIKIGASTSDVRLENVSANSLKVSVSTGDIVVSGADIAGEISIGVSTGEVYLKNVECKNLVSKGSTGDICLKNVIATETFQIERRTGEVEFNGSDAAEIYVETSTGDVEGTLLSSKVFIVETTSGDKDVPNSVTGGRCEIITSTGDISIRIIN